MSSKVYVKQSLEYMRLEYHTYKRELLNNENSE